MAKSAKIAAIAERTVRKPTPRANTRSADLASVTPDVSVGEITSASKRPAGKIGALVGSLSAPGGASLAELQSVTGWQAHSVRGALAGALKRKGFLVTSEVVEGVRRYALPGHVQKASTTKPKRSGRR